MSAVEINGSGLGNALEELLTAPDIIPGDQPSYQLCKTIYLYHPLGGKIAESPIAMAQCQHREISIPGAPEERVKEQFLKQWSEDRVDETILNTAVLARVYGIASLAMVCDKIPSNQPIPLKKLASLPISFSVFDPLNTAGSLVLNQNPNASDFQKVTAISVAGIPYHRSRSVTIMNGRPVYIAYTPSAFGFVGRSAYQRSLFPLKSFVQSMVTDDLITKKAGVFIAMLKAAGAIIDNIMSSMAGLKRLFVKQATTGNVISIGADEKIETLNLQNIDGAYGLARKNILENIAAGDDMPAQILNSETFAEGFGEGTEDAKKIARYIDRVRIWMAPLYDFMTPIIQRRAWNEEFYRIIQKDYPEYGAVSYDEAFYRWSSAFSAVWPSLLIEPESEQVKSDDVKLKAIIATVQVFGPMLDPENKATLIEWAQSNMNDNKIMFQTPLFLEADKIASYMPTMPMGGPKPEHPFAAADTAGMKRIRKLSREELEDLVAVMAQQPERLPLRSGHRESMVA